MPKIYAHCDRTGEINFTNRKNEEGLICLGGGYGTFRQKVETRARQARNGEVLLVPGVPEAANADDALEAVCLFADWLGDMSQEDLSHKYDIKGMKQRALDAATLT